MSLTSSSDSSRSAGPDFHLSDEILSVIPTDPYDQLDLARKITSMAIASRVTKLESETGKLRQKLHDKDRFIVELQNKVSQLEQACHETESRLKFTCEDNVLLVFSFIPLAFVWNEKALILLFWKKKMTDEAYEGEGFIGYDSKENGERFSKGDKLVISFKLVLLNSC